jgi:hypothetical protein
MNLLKFSEITTIVSKYIFASKFTQHENIQKVLPGLKLHQGLSACSLDGAEQEVRTYKQLQ